MQNNRLHDQSSVASQLLALLTLGSVAGTVIAAQNTSFPYAFSRASNTAQHTDSYSGAVNAHSQTSARHAASLRLPIGMAQPNIPAKAFSKSAQAKTILPKISRKKTIASHLASPQSAQKTRPDPDRANPAATPADAQAAHPQPDKLFSASLPHPPLSAAINRLSSDKERSFTTDASNMLKHQPAAMYMQPDDAGNSIGGVSCVGAVSIGGVGGHGPTTAFLGTQWWEYAHKMEEEEQLAEMQKTIERFARIDAIKFDPRQQSTQIYFQEYLKAEFKRHGLAPSDIHIPIFAVYYDTRHMNVASAHLQPTQLQPIRYEATWSVQDIATGKIFHEIEKNAGLLAAHMNQISLHWPTIFPGSLKKIITGDDLWTIFGEFMERRLTSGPLVDDAKKHIRAVITGILIEHFKDRPDVAEKLAHALTHIRSVSYREEGVVNMFLAPSVVEGAYGDLYSMNGDFYPITVDSLTTLSLRNPILQDAIKEGLPLSSPLKWGRYLFSTYVRNKNFPMPTLPHLVFSEIGHAANVMWPVTRAKFLSDMDFSVFSKYEQGQLFALGMAQTTLQAAIVIIGPPMSPWVTTAVGVLSIIPEGLQSQIIDDPVTAQMHLHRFFLGLMVEAIGATAYVGNQAIIRHQVSNAATRLMARPDLEAVEVRRLMQWAKQTIPAIPPKAAIFGGRLIAKTAEQIGAALSQTNPPTATQRSVLPYIHNNGSVAVPPLTKSVSFERPWETLSQEQKARLTLADMLTGTENLSPENGDLLLQGWEQAITDTFSPSGIKTPQLQADKLSVAAHRFTSVKYALMDLRSNLTRTEALIFANNAQPQPTMIDRMYFYALEQWMQARASDPALNRRILAHPSEEFRARMLLNTPERRDDFLRSLKENKLLNNPTFIHQLRTHPSSVLASEMLAFSSGQVDDFLNNFDEWALAQIGTFYSEALFYEYLCRKEKGEQWIFNASSHLPQILGNYKRALGIDRAIPYMIEPILSALGYSGNRPGLSGSYGQTLLSLRHRRELNAITGYLSLNDEEQLKAFAAVGAYTGLSKRPMGSLVASVEKALNLFPDGKGLAIADYPEGDASFLNQIIALDLAEMNNVRKVDTQWAEDFWQLMFNRRHTIPGLGQWLDKLMYDYPENKIDRIISAINRLHHIAKASSSETNTPQLRDFAIQLVKRQLRTPRIDGDSPGTRSGAIYHYLEQEMHKLDNQSLPASIQDWKKWVEKQPTDGQHPQPEMIATPHQKIINDTLAHAIETIDWPGAAALLPALRTPAHEEQTAVPRTGLLQDKLHGPLLLVQAGLKNIHTMIDGIKCDIRLITNENRATTTCLNRRTWHDGYFMPLRADGLNPPLAIDNINDRLYSEWPGDQTTLEVAGYPISDDPAVRKLPLILAFINDFTQYNSTEIFDKIFDFRPIDVAESQCNPRTLFRDFYNKSWLFRGLVNAAQPYVGKWSTVYGQPPSIDPKRNIMRFPWDADLAYLLKDIDLSGTQYEHALPRMYLNEWINILLQKEDKPGLNRIIANLILQQSGLAHLAYDPMDRTLPRVEQIEDFYYRFWLTKHLDAKIKMMVPLAFQNAMFTHNPSARMTVQQLKTLPILKKSLPAFPPHCFTVEAWNNSGHHLDHLNAIYHAQHFDGGLFAQLTATFPERLSADHPWHFIFETDEKSNQLTTYSASHSLDHQARVVRLVDTNTQPLISYLSTNGLAPLSPTIQAMIIMMEILTGPSVLTDEQACNNRGMAVALADICLKETNQKSPSPIAAAMIDTSETVANLHLLKNIIAVRRSTYDENKILKDMDLQPFIESEKT